MTRQDQDLVAYGQTRRFDRGQHAGKRKVIDGWYSDPPSRERHDLIRTSAGEMHSIELQSGRVITYSLLEGGFDPFSTADYDGMIDFSDWTPDEREELAQYMIRQWSLFIAFICHSTRSHAFGDWVTAATSRPTSRFKSCRRCGASVEERLQA